MKTFISKVIDSHRITIPKELRKSEGLSKGDLVELQFLRKINNPKKEGGA